MKHGVEKEVLSLLITTGTLRWQGSGFVQGLRDPNNLFRRCHLRCASEGFQQVAPHAKEERNLLDAR